MLRVAYTITFIFLIAFVLKTNAAARAFNETCSATSECLQYGECREGKCLCQTGYISILPTAQNVSRPISCMIIMKRGDRGCVEPRQCKRSSCYNGVCQ
uniref:EB domain-containing protein n=1 Tax=Plectus sambesii TaxID=2011161 RepID=A0A914X1C3_9BILA